MRNWLTIVLIFILLISGGLLLSVLRSGEPLTLTQGYVPVLDSTQALILTIAIGGLVVSTVGMGATLAIAIYFGGRQVAVAQSELAQAAAGGKAGEPNQAAPKAGLGRQINWSGAGRAGAIAANLLVLAFVAFLTLNHYVLNPPVEGEGEVEQPGGGIVEPTAPPPPPANPAELQAEFDALPAGDATAGETVFTSQPCASCHSMVPDQVIVGPSLAGIGTRAETQRPGYSPELYIYESVIHPSAYVVEGFQNGLMPPNFGQLLTPQQQADLVAYLLTVK